MIKTIYLAAMSVFPISSLAEGGLKHRSLDYQAKLDIRDAKVRMSKAQLEAKRNRNSPLYINKEEKKLLQDFPVAQGGDVKMMNAHALEAEILQHIRQLRIVGQAVKANEMLERCENIFIKGRRCQCADVPAAQALLLHLRNEENRRTQRGQYVNHFAKRSLLPPVPPVVEIKQMDANMLLNTINDYLPHVCAFNSQQCLHLQERLGEIVIGGRIPEAKRCKEAAQGILLQLYELTNAKAGRDKRPIRLGEMLPVVPVRSSACVSSQQTKTIPMTPLQPLPPQADVDADLKAEFDQAGGDASAYLPHVPKSLTVEDLDMDSLFNDPNQSSDYLDLPSPKQNFSIKAKPVSKPLAPGPVQMGKSSRNKLSQRRQQLMMSSNEAPHASKSKIQQREKRRMQVALRNLHERNKQRNQRLKNHPGHPSKRKV